MEGAGGFDVETVYCFGTVGEGVVRCVCLVWTAFRGDDVATDSLNLCSWVSYHW